MRKSIALFLVVLVNFQATPASAATVTLKVEKYFSATFDNNIRYKGQDCLTIKFKYKGDSGLSYPSQFESIGLYKLNGDDAGGYIQIKIGDTYGLNQGGDPVQGTKTMKLCQTPTTQLVDEDCDEEYQQSIGEECEYEEVAGVKPGKYHIAAQVVQIKPLLIKSSKNALVTIGK